LLFEVSTGTVGGVSTSPAAIAAPRDGAPLGGFASARAQLARLEATALAATRPAAMACQRWVGRGSGQAADAAATGAMRSALATAPGTGNVVIGEGVKDRAPMLYDGELVGTRRGPLFDIAVDPLECTTLCAKGLPGSLATIAFAETGSMARLGPSFYMDKLVGPPATRGAIDISDAPKANLARVAQALEKPIEQVRVVVLDKPRHAALIAEIRRAGAGVISPPDGDVAGALAPLLPGGAADLLMGIGGTPEGVMTACAVRAAGLSAERVYSAEDLVSGDAFFAATGVTGGELLRRPWRSGGSTFTHSVVVARGSIRKVVEASVEQA
jgi:fructose-1,6-bisphosphatase II